MNFKYLLIIGLAIVIIAVSPLAAADDDDVSMLDALDIVAFTEDTNVTIDGINFNVPKGFGEQKDIRRDDDVYTLGNEEVTLSNYQYLNEDGDFLNLQVISMKDKNVSMDSLTPDDGAVKKTINGKEGFYTESDDMAIFMYAQDGKSVQVSGDKDIISQIVQ